MSATPPNRGAVASAIAHVTKRFATFSILGVLLVAVVLSDRSADKIGDNVQLALPLAGLACAMAEGRGPEYFGRVLLLNTILHSSKTALGDLPINMRPGGSDGGFPSGHTSAAVFGAVTLIQGCLSGSKTAQAVAAISAGFVGAVRVEVKAHTAWQVLAGGVFGWVMTLSVFAFADRAFRWFWNAARSLVAALFARLIGAATSGSTVEQWQRRTMRVGTVTTTRGTVFSAAAVLLVLIFVLFSV